MAKQNQAQDSQDERLRSLITSSISNLTANITTVVDDRLAAFKRELVDEQGDSSATASKKLLYGIS